MESPTVESLAPTYVFKRDGVTRQPFDSNKIRKAIVAAATDAECITSPEDISRIVNQVCNDAHQHAGGTRAIGVEQLQDLVEEALMKSDFPTIAKAYIVYRESRAQIRHNRLSPDPNALADYIHPGKYARHLKQLKRREIYAETVARNEDMHLRKFAHIEGLEPEIRAAFDLVRHKQILPSMRSMQFGGLAIEKNNCRMFNCTFSFCNRMRFFAESIYLLLCGCGVGFSVQFEHVEQLPTLKYIDRNNVKHFVIPDSIEGWADAVEKLFDSYVKGYYVEFAYHKIRDKGEELITSGGKAPGHMKLKESLEKVRAILDIAQGRQLRPIECYDVMCHLATAVLSGGIRRSAMICLFSLEDSEMMNAKPKDYWKDVPGRAATPWRYTSNNSVMLKRDEVTKKTFKRIFKMTRQAGEPGFYFCWDFQHGTNPCVEIGLDCVLHITDDIRNLFVEEAKKKSYYPSRVPHIGETHVGWAFCNLTTQNAAKFETFADFRNSALGATFLGTLQASYTDFPYLGWVTELIAKRDALLGVSMTGIMSRPQVALDPEMQKKVAAECVELNKELAARLGIRPAARITCVKPEGTGSKELGIGEEGIHPAHARRYVQCVLANEDEAPFKHFQKTNPHMCVKVPGTNDWAIYFPMQAPDGAITRHEVTAIEFLQKVLSTQKNWVIPGTARPDQSPGLTHNVSNTVTVRDDEWESVADFIFENKNYFTGLSFLPLKGDKEYGPFAPKQSVETETDETRWNELVKKYKPVNYAEMVEEDDGTDLSGEAACAGGQCTI